MIGRTLGAIVLAGAIGTGGYFAGKSAGQDKDYQITRNGTEIFLKVMPTNESYKVQTYGSQTIFGNSDQVDKQYKAALTIEITDFVTKKMSGNTIDKTVSQK